MKTTVFKLMTLTALLAVFVSCSSDDDNNSEAAVGYAELPQASKLLIEANFSGATATRVTKNNTPEHDGTLYEVTLSNNYEIDFDSEGILINISGENKQVPDNLVPEAILEYVKANYSDLFIEEIDREQNGYELELSNDTELYFDLDGNFVSEDIDANDQDDDEKAMAYEDLPQAALTLIETHFSGAKAIFVSENVITDDDGTMYEVKLDNGFEIDFNESGNWISVDAEQKQVPDALVPEAILSYTQTNYPSPLFIEGIEIEPTHYQVELSDDTELSFDLEGNFTGVEN